MTAETDRLGRRYRLYAAAVLTIVLPWAAMASPASTPTYHVTRTIALGAPDRWDYVTFDPRSYRVYVAHGDHVNVIDGLSGAMVGNVTGMPGGTHGIGISTRTGQGFTDDGAAGSAVPFDLATLRPKNPVKAGADADGIVVDPSSGHVFVIDGDPGTLSVIDPETNEKVATIKGGGKLEFAVTDGRGHLFVDGEAKHEIVRVSTANNRADAHWPMPDCRDPHGLAIDMVSHRLFAGCANDSLTVMNADTGAVVATVPIGSGNDGVAFDPKRKLVLSANGGDGTMTVIREVGADSFTSVETVTTALGARTLAIDPASGRVFLVAADLAPESSARQRPKVRPGSVRLMFLDPSN